MRKKIIGTILRIAVSAGIGIYIFSKPDINLLTISAALKNIELSWLIPAFLTYKAAILLSSYRWLLLMKAHNIEVSYPHAVALNYLGCFFNNFMLSLTGGDIIKAYYASKLTSEKKAESATIVFIDRLVGIAGLLILGIASILLSIGNEGMHSAMIVIFTAGLVFVILGLLVFNTTLAQKFNKYTGRGRVKETFRKVYDAVYLYKSKKKVLVEALGLSILGWTLMILMNFQLARGLGVELSAGYYFVLIPVISIISTIPITIAGWGLREGMYKQFFGAVGVSGGAAVSLSVAFALIMLAWSLIGGVLYALHIPNFTAQQGEKKNQHTGLEP